MATGITVKKLKELLESHYLWLQDSSKGKRLDLSKRDLTNPKVIEILKTANLSNADLRYANLKETKNLYVPLSCPDEGSFIGWKKVRHYIIKLEIPAEAKRCSATGRKCRCSYAKVLEIQNYDGSKAEINSIINGNYYPHVEYIVGQNVYPDSFDEDRFNECSNGIHFFINRQEAVNY